MVASATNMFFAFALLLISVVFGFGVSPLCFLASLILVVYICYLVVPGTSGAALFMRNAQMAFIQRFFWQSTPFAMMVTVVLLFVLGGLEYLAFGGPIIDVETRDHGVWVERNRGGGWTQLSDPRLLWLHVGGTWIASNVLAPVVLLVLSMGLVVRKESENND